jgi:hypothetical protein
MYNAEFMSEMCHYDRVEGSPSRKIRDELTSSNLFDFFHETDAEFRPNFPDSQDEEFDITSIPMACQEAGFVAIFNKFDLVIASKLWRMASFMARNSLHVSGFLSIP